MIKSIIFDFDGVICDSVNIKTKAFSLIYKQYGSDIEKRVIKYHIENLGLNRYEKFKFFHENYLNITLKKEELDLLSSQFSNIVFNEIIMCDYISGSIEFVKNNYKKFLLFISSATPYEELKSILKMKKINNYFINFFGAPDSKSNHIKKIIKNYNLSKKSIVYIGDSRSDFKAANENNINFIGVINEYEKFNDIIYKIQNLNFLEKTIIKINNANSC